MSVTVDFGGRRSVQRGLLSPLPVAPTGEVIGSANRRESDAKYEKNATPGSPTFAEEHRQRCRDIAAEVEGIFARANVPPAEPTPPLTHGRGGRP